MSRPARGARRRLLAPEVVQTSAMDCGPAALKCLLEGFGVPVSYGRLREACQTDVDGTSIDTMEEVAAQLGLEAEQIMVPLDHILLRGAELLPALVVVCLPSGLTHFVVLWRRHGPLVQVMDPAVGRRWLTRSQFLDEVYLHAHPVPASAWCDWARSDAFLGALRRRLAGVGVAGSAGAALVAEARADPGWQSLAALDAAVRAVDAIVGTGALGRGAPAARVLERLCSLARAAPDTLAAEHYSVTPAPPGPEGGERLFVRGAVLVHIRGRRAAPAPSAEGSPAAEPPTPLSPELVAALEEQPPRPGRELIRLLRAEGRLAPLALLSALALAAFGVVAEAVLLRGLLGFGAKLGLTGQRLGAMALVLVFASALLLLELPIANGLLRLGRRLEIRLRAAFLQKLPRLGDSYFRSRLTSDMAERGHSIHQIRMLPVLGGDLVRSVFELVLTTAGIAWLDPASAPLALLTLALALVLPAAAQPLLAERDLRVRSHGAALGRFYLDALLGLVAVRAHGAQRAMRAEHESLLVEWASAGLRLQRAAVAVEGLQLLCGFGLAAWLLFTHMTRAGDSGGILLLVYWALNLPVLAQEVTLLARQYPAHRNLTLRLLEPLGAREAEDALARQGTVAAHAPAASGASGVAVAFEDVSVRAAGHTILEGIDLALDACSHVAIVGASGAGKSSLVGLLLGWHRPAAGRILVDGAPLDGLRLAELRRETAWVDPAVQLWNHSFLDNLRYGSPEAAAARLGEVLDATDLHRLLEKLPAGLQTALGEGGALVSGGEGQRVRLARAMLRAGVRLAILDEPFRGLDRERRRELLRRAREIWARATVLCVTHDVDETQAFDRVLVVDGGRIVEDGHPRELALRPGSRYAAMLEAEIAVREGLWSSAAWRRLRLEDGRLLEEGRPVPRP